MEILVMLVVLLLVLNWISASGHRRAQQAALDKIERKVDLVMAEMGVVVPEPAGVSEVDQLIRAERRVQAIKRYREITGEGLVEAKTAVDLRASRLP